jgi:hypothetical protein
MPNNNTQGNETPNKDVLPEFIGLVIYTLVTPVNEVHIQGAVLCKGIGCDSSPTGEFA